MKRRRLGKTGLDISVVGLGTWQFGGEWGQTFAPKDVATIIDKAKDLGINFIDTAECYGDHLSESLVGQAIERDRASWIVATKFGHHFHGHLDRSERWSPQQVIEQLDASLRALRTDYIDLYQFHSGDDAAFDQDELWTMLDKQVSAGKIRYLGNSIGDNRNVYQTARSTDVGVSVIQVVYNRLDRGPEDDIFQSVREQDLGLLAREPLSNGLLSGKYAPGSTFGDLSDWRSTAWQADVLRDKLRAVERIQREEVPAGMSVAAWALAWAIKSPVVTAVIPGCKSVAQLQANAEAAALELSPLS
ncbi:aryl-alcohol dehydrogenase-like predicted oxidoreductase [Novosphingobium kunmingense]|uniref:Aryl-alcohol dehydrogenase-like predicted oxidoreductase n=1 Tax=Novosphingobium kunmingense TaxID=1211806 RepID=A0A2N0H7K9_9SPHN|nr:aldo/keto reductase [Novosphingobium kunmingense]PKB14932.1 aryl-alcohol dehydrogenase-like predicted oxidoreductase [Novosphingobium kunmingense]